MDRSTTAGGRYRHEILLLLLLLLLPYRIKNRAASKMLAIYRYMGHAGDRYMGISSRYESLVRYQWPDDAAEGLQHLRLRFRMYEKYFGPAVSFVQVHNHHRPCAHDNY